MKVNDTFSTGEEIANSITHGIGAALSIAALIFLIIKAVAIGTAWHIVSYTIFGITLTTLYLMSTLYHSLPCGTVKRVFERFDHISIYLLIAGSYTPFCFTVLRGRDGWILFGIQWFLAIIGIIFKSIWIDKYVKRTTFIFILMGWFIIFTINAIYSSIGGAGFFLLAAGGVSYTLGTIFFIFPLFKYHHAIWHIFVLAGSILHFFTIYFYLT